MSKGGISERIEGKFGGVYSGGASTEGVKKAVETANLVLFLGNYPVGASFHLHRPSTNHGELERLQYVWNPSRLI
jgi:TPP-dependent 2-oxoacid decarboxylase